MLATYRIEPGDWECATGEPVENDVTVVKIPDNLREVLADRAHEAWAHWMAHIWQTCDTNADGSVTIPRHLVSRWAGQAGMFYDSLSEKQKESDRAEADKTLKAIELAVQQGPHNASVDRSRDGQRRTNQNDRNAAPIQRIVPKCSMNLLEVKKSTIRLQAVMDLLRKASAKRLEALLEHQHAQVMEDSEVSRAYERGWKEGMNAGISCGQIEIQDLDAAEVVQAMNKDEDE